MEIRLATASDYPEILKLLQSEYPFWTQAQFRWQVQDNPAGEARIYIVHTDGQIAAMYMAVPHAMRLHTWTNRAFRVQCVITKPAYRGQGFLQALAERCKTDIIESGAVGYTFPNEKSEGSFKKAGWTLQQQVPLRTYSGTYLLENTINQDYEPLYTKWDTHQNLNGVSRTFDYLDWRYRKPFQEYLKNGHCVLKEYENKLHILEFISDHPKADLNRILALAGGREVTAWVPTTSQYSLIFVEAGFKFTPPNRNIYTLNAPDVLDWHFTMGDSDVY